MVGSLESFCAPPSKATLLLLEQHHLDWRISIKFDVQGQLLRRLDRQRQLKRRALCRLERCRGIALRRVGRAGSVRKLERIQRHRQRLGTDVADRAADLQACLDLLDAGDLDT